MHHSFQLKDDYRKMGDDMNGGRNKGGDETTCMVNTENARHKVFHICYQVG